MRRPKLRRGVVIEVTPHGCVWLALEFTRAVRPSVSVQRFEGGRAVSVSLGFVLFVLGYTRP